MYCIKQGRQLILWVAVLFAAVHSVAAQRYYNMPGDTIIAHANFNDIGVFNITQVHPAADTLYFKWYRLLADMPSAWEASICDNGNCYTALLDSGMMAPIVPGDDGLMSLHLDPKSEPGTGIIRYLLFAANSTAQADTLTWIITAGAPSLLPGIEIVRPVIYTADHQLTGRNLNGLYATAWLYDLSGKLLLRQSVKGDEMHIPIPYYAVTMFILRLSGKRNFITKVLNH